MFLKCFFYLQINVFNIYALHVVIKLVFAHLLVTAATHIQTYKHHSKHYYPSLAGNNSNSNNSVLDAQVMLATGLVPVTIQTSVICIHQHTEQI